MAGVFSPAVDEGEEYVNYVVAVLGVVVMFAAAIAPFGLVLRGPAGGTHKLRGDDHRRSGVDLPGFRYEQLSPAYQGPGRRVRRAGFYHRVRRPG